MENKHTYERIVKQACVGRVLGIRICAYLGYVAFALCWVIPIILSFFQPLMIALAALLTFALIALTRKYLHVEYEYEFVGGEITVSKIYGKKKRKLLFSDELKNALLIAPATDEHIAALDRLSIHKTVSALASPASQNILLLVFDGASGKPNERLLLLIESDERTISACRRAAPTVCARELRSNL